MGLQHSTERKRMTEYESDKYDTMEVKKEVNEGEDMIARTLVISVKKSPPKRKSPVKKASTKRKSPVKKSPPKRKSPVKKSPPKRKSPVKKASTKKK